MQMVEEMQKKFQVEVQKFKQVKSEYDKALSKRQQLDGQLNENKAVQIELNLLKPEDEVYKLLGPVLVKQDSDEAKQNVTKRLAYISSELDSVENLISSLDKKMETHRQTLDEINLCISKLK